MKYHYLKTIIVGALITGLLSCNSQPEFPNDATPTETSVEIYPDYKDITIPPNIAPLNFQIKLKGDAFAVSLEGKSGKLQSTAGKNGKFDFDSLEWRQLLESNKGTDIKVTLYSQQTGRWQQHPSYTLTVANEPIDRYLSYRLIEPSYELYRQLGLYQRDLENFTEKAIYENNRSYDSENNHCVNCHNYQNYSTDRMLFHVRAKHGGSVFIEKGIARKLNMRCDSILSNTVYPTWHPTENWVVFSSNQTGQAFHMVNHQKVEVIDYGSDLVFFDADQQTLTNIFRTKGSMETFPCWSPDGNRLFYCNAEFQRLQETPDSTHSNLIIANYDSIYYNVMSVPFDISTRTFGVPRMEVNADSLKKSASVPRISPDGNYLLFTLGDYGQFHIWHKSADLYVKDLQNQNVYALEDTNSHDAESYHTWSSNGRWIVFASRREDGSYSRVHIAYFTSDGKGKKAFLLPQQDPEHNQLRLKSYNVPELTHNAVQISPEQLKEVIYNDTDVKKVTYQSAFQ